jgi:ribosome-associated protein
MDETIETLAHAISEAAWDRKALDLEIIDVRNKISYCDYFILCSGRTDRQVQAIANGIASDLRESGYRPRGVEGTSQGLWVLMDFGDLVVHIFHMHEREKYNLERMWEDAPRLEVEVPEGLRTERGPDGMII